MSRRLGNMTELVVCIGSSCHLKGSYNIIQTFQQMIEEQHLHEKIDFKANFCMKRCDQSGVSLTLNGKAYSIAPESAREFFNEKVMPCMREESYLR
jgi:NADH:ubiquinone oxidoreductase subunit E